MPSPFSTLIGAVAEFAHFDLKMDRLIKQIVLPLFKGRLQSQDSGKHLHDVLDLLQKHNLVEADISAQAERIKAVQGAAKRFTSYEQSKSWSLVSNIPVLFVSHI